VILPDDNDENSAPFPDIYWNACAALYAYEYGNLALQNISWLGMSQMVGYPTQFPRYLFVIVRPTRTRTPILMRAASRW
jgi:hypothetical protein